MASNIALRPATLQDCPGLLEIESHAFQSDRLKPRQMRYLLTRARARTWIAQTEDQLAGYCSLLLPALPRPARLYSLAVRSEFQGRGIAKNMLHMIKSEAKKKGYTRIRLEVSTKNGAAKSLYDQFGFYPITLLPGYYEDGSNGVRLQLDITLNAQSVSIHL
jgi:ribosomal protein S18 acetylase RimI-like enzyme